MISIFSTAVEPQISQGVAAMHFSTPGISYLITVWQNVSLEEELTDLWPCHLLRVFTVGGRRNNLWMVHSGNDRQRKPNNSETNLPRCHCVRHKPRMNWPAIARCFRGERLVTKCRRVATAPKCFVHQLCFDCRCPVGWDSSVGIATRYGLDGPGIESRWGGGEIFHTLPDRPWGPPTLLSGVAEK